MEAYRAIPDGYMTVGRLAKEMGTTVRTLQYYDRIGLLKPSAESEGGRRLYTHKDAVILDQILSLKSLGFSLEEIRHHLLSLDTPDEVARALAGQAEAIRRQIETLSVTLSELEALRGEVLRMRQVDFKRYAAIIHNLQMRNGEYRMIKYLDDDMLEYGRTRFSREEAMDVMETNRCLNAEALRLARAGVLPESEEGQRFAAAFWRMIESFTGGDTAMLPTLIRVGITTETEKENTPEQAEANAFIGQSLHVYLTSIGVDVDAILEGIK